MRGEVVRNGSKVAAHLGEALCVQSRVVEGDERDDGVNVFTASEADHTAQGRRARDVGPAQRHEVDVVDYAVVASPALMDGFAECINGGGVHGAPTGGGCGTS